MKTPQASYDPLLAPYSASAPITTDAVDRRTLPTTVADRLREMIIEGQLPAGSRLNERALCDLLQVSRTPLREAFRLLSAEGLVRMQPNRGAQVIALSEKDVRESFEVMCALEALSGELACQRISEEEIAEIKALTFEMQACHARRDLSSYYHVNRQIHDLINAAGHNDLLSTVYKTINLRLQNLRFRSNLNHDKWDQAMLEHQEMVDALVARDGARMAKVMRLHLQRKGETVLENLNPPPTSD
ncbi:GntR family transcriptional regulator [Parapusillimonas granuli]|uniref:GntR family transcriptional regulator n=1 Tax=Parapusillimonas granuli TaxID=380911 RepID=A0A853FVJ5_9BURK|nr:GntR family transcriptional regulator [Parapusillimonas granuli]MBB5217474.1 DNA-binding GntR family transcriptional regulator [Parapusillimonas granuli]MEB2401747.1 GntR family transcriptional regulator [Alcaligenaceae bacterium]NYT50034.1 GntR family transcriptional regulator [Parapusillimonas granuli]